MPKIDASDSTGRLLSQGEAHSLALAQWLLRPLLSLRVLLLVAAIVYAPFVLGAVATLYDGASVAAQWLTFAPLVVILGLLGVEGVRVWLRHATPFTLAVFLAAFGFIATKIKLLNTVFYSLQWAEAAGLEKVMLFGWSFLAITFAVWTYHWLKIAWKLRRGSPSPQPDTLTP